MNTSFVRATIIRPFQDHNKVSVSVNRVSQIVRMSLPKRENPSMLIVIFHRYCDGTIKRDIVKFLVYLGVDRRKIRRFSERQIIRNH